MADRPPQPERSIRPLKPTTMRLPIIAATLNGCTTLDGGAFPLNELPGAITSDGPGLLVTNNSHDVLLYLEKQLGHMAHWQVKVTVREGMIARHDDRIRVRKTIIGFVGLQREAGVRTANRYWHMLDPSIFLDDAKASMPLEELALWADDVQSWCVDNGIKIRPTAGGIAGQLLRHPRFYPDARRKVPGATNERARLALPGNHYELRADRHKKYTADYIDQHCAHHHAALTTGLPSDNIYALGHYRDLRDEHWATLDEMGDHLGLLHARIWTPGHAKHRSDWESESVVDDYRPEWARISGSRLAYLFTNELDLLHELGGRVEYVTAAWLADRPDPGLPLYARWSLAQTATADAARRSWLKRVLLTPYGILAAKPDHFEVGYRRAKKGEVRPYPIGSRMVDFIVRRSAKPVHPRIAHVVQRGMIEAETRKRSIRYANELLESGEHVLCIYGDGILVRTLPWRNVRGLLPEPWRWKGRLTDLHFISEQAFESQQVVRLPGIPVAGRAPKVVTD